MNFCRGGRMTDKRFPNQRRLPATLPPPPVKQESIPDSSSALAITNRFTPLGSTIGNIRPNYQTALVTKYDPFSSQYRPSSSSQTSYPKSSPYMLTAQNEYLFSIPPNLLKESAPEKIVKSVFPPNFHYPSTKAESFKTIKFYLNILCGTDSIAIKPIYNFVKGKEHEVLYHSIFINKFILESDWGIPLYQSKTLHALQEFLPNNHYNYQDYIQAWTNVFLHQSEDFSHSWFINFHKGFRLQFPAWFPRWWSSHGLAHSLLPADLNQALAHFQQRFDRSRFDSRISFLSLFLAKYKVPWIFKWNYVIDSKEVFRQHSSKWWDKFVIDKVISLVLADFPIAPSPAVALQPALPPAQSSPTKALPDFPETTQSLLDISPSSSAKGNLPSLRVRRKRTKESPPSSLILPDSSLLSFRRQTQVQPITRIPTLQTLRLNLIVFGVIGIMSQTFSRLMLKTRMIFKFKF